MDQICKIALEQCILIYENARGAEKLQGDVYGTFPQSAQITQVKTIFGKTKLSDKKEKIQFWKYENKELVKVETIKDREHFLRDGMFYNVASIDFEIMGEKIRIVYVFGPRFGRCVEFEIKYENGIIFLGEEKHIWVS